MGLGGNPSKRGLTLNRAARFHRAFLDLLFAQLDFAQLHYDYGAKLQVILAVVETVGDFGHEVLGLYGTNGNLKLQSGAPQRCDHGSRRKRKVPPLRFAPVGKTDLFCDEKLISRCKLISR